MTTGIEGYAKGNGRRSRGLRRLKAYDDGAATECRPYNVDSGRVDSGRLVIIMTFCALAADLSYSQ